MQAFILSDEVFVVYELDNGEALTTSREYWEQLFGNAKTYTELVNSPNCTDGWKKVFDQMKAMQMLH